MSKYRSLTHEQARQLLQIAADGRLEPARQPALEHHLVNCPECQLFAQQLSALETRLNRELPVAWPASQVNEKQLTSIMHAVHTQTRPERMKTLFSTTARTLGFAFGIILLIAGLAWGINNLRPALPGIQPAGIEQPVQDTPAENAQATSMVETANPVISETEEPQLLPAIKAPELFPNTLFIFPTGFPESPAALNLYRLQLPDVVTAESALQMAARLGVSGGVYYQPAEGFDQVLYEVTDGFKLVRFINFAEQFVLETGYADPLYSGGEPLPYAEQLRIATDFLNSYGLLDQPYRSEPSAIEQGVVRFTPLLAGYPVIYGNGQNPGNLEWVSVQVNPNGQVSRVMYSQQAFTAIGEFPVLIAEQAWERLSSPDAAQRALYAVMPASQPNTYRVWTRPYPQGQSVEIYGFVQIRQPVDPADPVLISLNDFQVTGVENLTGLDTGANIHAWGQFIPDDNGNLIFNLERWEISPVLEEYYEGTIQRSDGIGQLVTADRVMLLPDLPADVPDGFQVFITGILQSGEPATLDWFHITGGEYPSSYYTSQSCGGGGGGGSGGGENVNFGGGSFARLNLELGQPPTATPEPGPYSTGTIIEGVSGQVYATLHQYSNGTSTSEYYIMTEPTEEEPYGAYFRLEGEALSGLEQYHELPVRIWGQVTGNYEGTPVVTVARYAAQYPGLQIQQWNGTEAILTLEGQDVVLLTDTNGVSYVLQSSLTWGAEGNIVGILGELIEIEGYLIPDRQFGDYPVIQDLSGGFPPDGELTSGTPYIFDHSLDVPDITTLMAGEVTIDSVGLAYSSITMEHCLSRHNTDPDMLPYLTVQPVWVFNGHFADGRLVIIQVQALPDEYLQ